MNELDGQSLDTDSFAFRDLIGQDIWTRFDPTVSLTVVGTPTYSGRYRFVGRQGFFQYRLSSSTSIASTAGTSYVSLPFTAMGLAGMAVLSNESTNIAVGVCHVDVTTSRVYLPTLGASGDTFTVAGFCEV